MNWVAVGSSNLVAVSYDRDRSILYVQFRNGHDYVYYNVPSDMYYRLLDAPSRGAFFNKNIARRFHYARL
ncbi:KTSC domain-containing protein [Paenibacillus sp. Z6-24]